MSDCLFVNGGRGLGERGAAMQAPEILLLNQSWFGHPAWVWLIFLCVVVFLLWLDLGVLHRKSHTVSPLESLMLWSIFVAFATGFGAWVWTSFGQEAGLQFFTGYLLETSLAFDNIFVISTIFAYFSVPRAYQHRVLFWGIVGAIVFRAVFIISGAALIERFSWVLYLFAGLLLFTGFKLATAKEEGPNVGRNPVIRLARATLPVTDRIEGDRFFVKRPIGRNGASRLLATPLFLALLAVEFVDIIFAIDSVPAIFAVTQDAFLVYTSNIFAILGLRSMYFMLAAAVERFKYLKFGLSLILILIGLKIFWNFAVEDFGLHETMGLHKLDAAATLAATLSIIAASILFSLWRTRNGRHA